MLVANGKRIEKTELGFVFHGSNGSGLSSNSDIFLWAGQTCQPDFDPPPYFDDQNPTQIRVRFNLFLCWISN